MEGTRTEKYLEGTEPTETAVPADTLTLDAFLMDQAEPAASTDSDAGSAPPIDTAALN